MIEKEEMECILNSSPYPIVFVDTNHIIKFLNTTAKHLYYTQRGYDDLIGKSLFDCHNKKSKERIINAVESLKNHGNEIFLTVTSKNQRLYICPVRNKKGELIGYYERFENNFSA